MLIRSLKTISKSTIKKISTKVNAKVVMILSLCSTFLCDNEIPRKVNIAIVFSGFQIEDGMMLVKISRSTIIKKVIKVKNI